MFRKIKPCGEGDAILCRKLPSELTMIAV